MFGTSWCMVRNEGNVRSAFPRWISAVSSSAHNIRLVVVVGVDSLVPPQASDNRQHLRALASGVPSPQFPYLGKHKCPVCQLGQPLQENQTVRGRPLDRAVLAIRAILFRLHFLDSHPRLGVRDGRVGPCKLELK